MSRPKLELNVSIAGPYFSTPLEMTNPADRKPSEKPPAPAKRSSTVNRSLGARPSFIEFFFNFILSRVEDRLCCWALLRVDPHPRFRLQPGRALGDAQVVVHLEVEPQLRRYTEVFAQTQGGVGGDGALAVDDVTDAVGWHGDFARERVDAHLHRLHEFLVEDFAGVDRFEQFCGHVLSYEW